MQVSPALRQHRLLADAACQTLSTALDYEERGQDEQALEAFRKGAKQLGSALQVKFVTTLDE